jgi:hypothetical protein
MAEQTTQESLAADAPESSESIGCELLSPYFGADH